MVTKIYKFHNVSPFSQHCKKVRLSEQGDVIETLTIKVCPPSFLVNPVPDVMNWFWICSVLFVKIAKSYRKHHWYGGVFLVENPCYKIMWYFQVMRYCDVKFYSWTCTISAVTNVVCFAVPSNLSSDSPPTKFVRVIHFILKDDHQQVLPHMQLGWRFLSSILSQGFDAIDVDGDGRLTEEEILSANWSQLRTFCSEVNAWFWIESCVIRCNTCMYFCTE